MYFYGRSIQLNRANELLLGRKGTFIYNCFVMDRPEYQLVSLHEVMSENVKIQYRKRLELHSTYLMNYYLFQKSLNLTRNRVFQNEQ